MSPAHCARALRRRITVLRQAAPGRCRAVGLLVGFALFLYLIYVLTDIYLLDLDNPIERGLSPEFAAELYRRTRSLAALSTWLKYLSLLPVMAISFVARPAVGQLRRASLNQAAFAFTLVADAYIMLVDRPILGILVFCCAQITRVVLFGGRRRAVAPILFALGTMFVLLEFAPAGNTAAHGMYEGALIPELANWFRSGSSAAEPPLHSQLAVRNALAGAYAVLLLTAVLYSWRTSGDVPRTGSRHIAGCGERYTWRAGMLLFLACDIHVLFYNVLPETHLLWRMASVLMWFFYLPSQLLLALAPTRLSAGGCDLGSAEERRRLDGGSDSTGADA
ncbi:MAG: hypothetical protein QM296_02870 [Bacillota bacterium]|nr:hypothetical protein [Bacillota bacterium]